MTNVNVEIKLHENDTLKDLDQKVTKFNIDPLCEFVNGTYKKENLWVDKEAETEFANWFEKNCYYNKSCKFDPAKIFKDSNFWDKTSDSCKRRIQRYKLTSPQYIAIVGCNYDDIKIPFSRSRIHKEWIGIVIIISDILSISTMYFFFSKIGSLNDEFLSVLDDLKVQMKDFGVKIDNLRLDRYT